MSVTERASRGKRLRDDGGDDEAPCRRVKQESRSEDWEDDPHFFFQDGDVTILAGRTKFKLSRFVLKRGSTLMQEALQGMDPVEVTITESAEDVRALAWVTHISPLPKGVAIDRLIAVLSIAHKFQFFPHAEWAKQAIFGARHEHNDSSLEEVLARASETDLEKLLAALMPCSVIECQICKAGAEEQIPAVWGAWLSRLQNDVSISLRPALDCAHALGLRAFLGRLYYLQLVVMNARAGVLHGHPATSACAILEDSKAMLDLSVEHRAALYQGYWSLSRFWDSIRHPPDLDVFDLEAHNLECNSAWERMWGEGIQCEREAPFTWNPIGALLRLSKLMDSTASGADPLGSLPSYIRCGCYYQAKAGRIRQQLLATLADHFVGPYVSHDQKQVEPPKLQVVTLVPQQPTERSLVASASASVSASHPNPVSPSSRHNTISRHSSILSTPPPRVAPPKQDAKGKKRLTKGQRKRAAKEKEAARVSDTDATTAILIRGWEMQHGVGSSRAASFTALTPPLNNNKPADTPVPMLDDSDQPRSQPGGVASSDSEEAGLVYPDDDPPELPPRTPLQSVAPAVQAQAPGDIPHVLQHDSQEALYWPPTQPLDWAQSQHEVELSQTTLLFYRDGASPAKVPKTGVALAQGNKSSAISSLLREAQSADDEEDENDFEH